MVKDDDLDYEKLLISEGTEAMLTWADLLNNPKSTNDTASTREALLNYCKLDTLAMVRIWQVLEEIVD